MKSTIDNTINNNFLKKVTEIKLKDDKNRMGALNNSNLYSTQFDGVVSSKNNAENSYNIK